MNLPDFLKGLIVDSWYKAFIYIGALAFLTSLFVDVKGLTNFQLQILSGGMFFIGVGEWINHKTNIYYKSPNVYTGPGGYVYETVWKPSFIGILFDLIGMILLIAGIWHIVK